MLAVKGARVITYAHRLAEDYMHAQQHVVSRRCVANPRSFFAHYLTLNSSAMSLCGNDASHDKMALPSHRIIVAASDIDTGIARAL
mmetsp:Transcript_29980/g.56043  ORF Transcript_29980/g.56043 Transcript_29980/m.56043 type:complete len:86 (+) Transcript_29980:70-327(+)